MRSRNWIVLLILLVLGILILFSMRSCQPKRFYRDTLAVAPAATDSFRMSASTFAVSHWGPCAARGSYDSAATGHGRDTAGLGIALQNRYCHVLIPEYHDEQRFRNGNREYGWYAEGLASPWTGTYSSHASFDAAYLNVAIVRVVGSGPPAPGFLHLHLQAGFNCIYLKHIHRFDYGSMSNVEYYEGAIAPPDAGGNCSEEPFTAGSGEEPDGVNYVHVVDEQPSTNPDDYPPVLRFQESRHGTSGGPLTYIGVRCGNRWCMIGAKMANQIARSTYLDLPSLPIPTTSSRWKVRGWFDDQHVGITTASGGSTYGIVPDSAASFVPVDNLAQIDGAYDDGWQHVGTIVFPYRIPEKYRTKGFVQGANKLWLKHDRLAGPDLGWKAALGNDPTTPGTREWDVIRHDHGASGLPVIGTTRFRWKDNDEAFWVECKIGCCYIEMY